MPLSWMVTKLCHFDTLRALFTHSIHIYLQPSRQVWVLPGRQTRRQVFSWPAHLKTCHMVTTVKLLKCWTPETFAVITLTFKQSGSTIEYCVQRCRRNGKQCRPWSDCSSLIRGVVSSGLALFVQKLIVITVHFTGAETNDKKSSDQQFIKNFIPSQ